MTKQKKHPRIKHSQSRKTVLITFSDGQVLKGPVGETIESFVQSRSFSSKLRPVACHVDGQLRELTYLADQDRQVRVLTLADSDGRRVYRRSLSLLLVAAAHELFPKAKILIDYGLNFGALYCQVRERPPFSKAELKQLEDHMRAMTKADIPIIKERISHEEARVVLKNLPDKLRLLKCRYKPYMTVYQLGDYRDYLHGYMVPSTGYLETFAIGTYSDSFVLRYPNRNSPTELQHRVEYPKLVSVFKEYGDWMDKLSIRNVGALNEVITSDNHLETIMVAEALQEQRISQIATLLASLQKKIRLVLISGPSSSGKTTFSKRLAIQLLAHGIHPLILGLDDFIVNREDTPLDEEGDYDYESIHSLNLSLFNDLLLRLIAGETVDLPHYNFLTGKSEIGQTVSLGPDQLIIVEGIHGMNPDLVPYIPPEKIYRIFVSALTQLNLDRHNRIPTTDTRLLRRIVRDAKHRGYSAIATLTRWPKVRLGEYRWIFPYQENADVVFNSALVYELACIKPLVEPLLRQVEPGTSCHIEVKRLLSFLQWFVPCSPDLIPPNSILREFIGQSVLRPYKPGLKNEERRMKNEE
ncbi:nucleoside kinase [Anaerolineales bacterium HSG24]|nr:nucleoside kinase [Anaerolineales bacterium HSG24]